MLRIRRPKLKRLRRGQPTDYRLLTLQVGLALILTAMTVRLFSLEILSHGFYAAVASDQHDIFERLFPERGEIYLSDPKSPDGRFPVAVNKNLSLLYADTRQIDSQDIPGLATALADILYPDQPAQSDDSDGTAAADPAELTPEERAAAEAARLAVHQAKVDDLAAKLSAEDDPYVPIQGKLDDTTASRIRALDLPGIAFAKQTFRFYPEGESASHLTGFVGLDKDGEQVGRYGVEGYWNGDLTGSQGYLESERDPAGRIITAGGHEFKPADDGADILLTVDRNIQFVACAKLREAVQRHQAIGGAVVIMEPKTGRIMAMCGDPDFDPNDYSHVADMSAFNNPATYYAYEPGSIFKAITMAGAIDAGKVTPKTTYEDTGEVKIGKYTIRNSDGLANGIQTMTQVLEKSLNTGAIFAVRQLGAENFQRYVEAFGFGRPTGLEIDSESKGDISSVSRRGDIWSATASYGQGITVTPTQMVAAYAALANGGKLMRPYVVDQVLHPDGSGHRTEPQAVRQVVSKRAADLVSGMLVRVVENGHGKRAGVPGYWVAGKTGTAQISDPGGDGYLKDQFIGSFVGFAPVDDPAFVMLTKIERPQGVSFAESSAAPLFGDIAAYLLQYLQIPPDRPIR